MAEFVIGEVLGTERKTGVSASGKDYDMSFVTVLSRGVKSQVLELMLSDELIREGRPQTGDVAAYEVSCDARVFRGVGSVSYTAHARSKELEDALRTPPLHVAG